MPQASACLSRLTHCVSETLAALAGDDIRAQVAELGEALQRFIDIVRHVDVDPSLDDPELTEIGEFGADLLLRLRDLATAKGLVARVAEIDEVFVPLGLWLHEHGAAIRRLQPVVDVLARIANSSQDLSRLRMLCADMEDIVAAVDPQISAATDDDNPGRPWRVLLLNYGIVATRTHDPQCMDRAFELLIRYLPGDAPGFFAEGMRQMDVVGYPPAVRSVMQRYYERYTMHALH